MVSHGVPNASAIMLNPECGDTSTSQALTAATWSSSGASTTSTDLGMAASSSSSSQRLKVVLVRSSSRTLPTRQNVASG